MNDIIGKTVKGIEVQQWAGRDTYKDDVTWQLTVITFTDGSTVSFGGSDGDVYDPYRAVFDDDGHPHRLVEVTTTCRHCGRGIGHDPDDGWVDPEAGFDVDDGDGIWRSTCENHDTFTAEHEPKPSLEERLAALPPPWEAP